MQRQSGLFLATEKECCIAVTHDCIRIILAETVIGKLKSISDSEYDEFAFEDNYAD